MSRGRTVAEQVVAQILSAYRRGYFPMADLRSGQVFWHNPDTRGVIPITAPAAADSDERAFRVPRSLRQKVRAGRFHVTCDQAFAATIVGCADPRRAGAWIDETIIRTYRLLHEAGYAHSIEAWLPPENHGEPPSLVGGLYGVSIGSAFFGESMFSLPEKGGTDASKVCLVHLVAHLRRRGYTLLDTQMWSWHLEQFGCEEVERDAFMPLLDKAVRKRSVTWGDFAALPTDADPDTPPRPLLPGS